MSETPAKTPQLQKAIDFLSLVKQHTERDNGAKAALKRALTGEQRHITAIYPIVLPHLKTKYNEDEWILVACLSTYYPPQELKYDKLLDFGYSARRLKECTRSEGVSRRFRALLDTSLEDLRSPLCALVRQMKPEKIPVDYPKLLVDLCNWEHYDQFIQDQWARTFWKALQQEEDS